MRYEDIVGDVEPLIPTEEVFAHPQRPLAMPKAVAIAADKLLNSRNFSTQKVKFDSLIPTQDVVGRDKVNKMSEDWDWKFAEPLEVLSYNGQNFLIDGHHTAVAGNGAGEEEFPAHVFYLQTKKGINESVLFEGGNMWKGDLAPVRIPQALVKPTVAFLEKITGLPLLNNMLGSTGLKETSGDLDLGVDSKIMSKEELAAKLKAWADKKDPSALVAKTGISVHFRCPIAGKPSMNYVQVDFMFLDDVNFAKWIMRLDPTSQYKNVGRTILIASVAKVSGYKFSYTHGLLDRATQKPIKGGTNPDVIAQRILNPGATADDLRSIESILAALKNDPQQAEKLKDALETLPKYGIEIQGAKY